MTESLVIEILSEVFYTSFLVLLPVLGLSLLVGVAISIFQAATSIQEMTLTFVPKIMVTALAIVFFLPWMLDKVLTTAIKIFTMISTVSK
ncbi:MAG: flagellar type III secretion system protein FliQ [Bacteroidetes bacterium]|nr:flagellar type III secretion system protein FliQ [Bacteroidota bacterium]MCH8033258.1 flagellar type III secretion system protein FliQ [Bacteroidota bacterium]